MKLTQKDRIINYIREFGSITSKEAYDDLGITQFGARVDDLERDGFAFIKEWETGKNRFGEEATYKRYYLEDMISDNINHITQ